MKKYPFIKQDGIKDCGCVCLSMIVKYYHGYIEIEKLRDLTKTTKQGTTAYHLIEAAKKIGFEAYGVSTCLEKLNKNNLLLPCLAHVVIDEKYKHFMVIYEINYKKKYLIVADPNKKIIKFSFEEFNKIWKGILIILHPVKKLPLDKNLSLSQFYIKIISMYRKSLINICLLSMFITIFSIFSSLYIKYVIDSINYSKNYLILIFIIFLYVNLLKSITDFFRNKLLIYINQKLDLSLTLDTFKNIVLLPYHYYRNRTTGEIISRINDLDSIRDMVSKVSLTLFIDFPLTLITIIILYIINSTLFFIALIILILYLLIIIMFRNPLKKNTEEIQEIKAETTSYMIESISGFETVKGINIENNVIIKFENKYVKFIKKLFKYENLNNIIYFLKELINNLGYVIIVFVGSLLVFDEKMTMGNLMAFISLLTYFLEPIRTIIDLDLTIKHASNSLKRVLNLLLDSKEKGIIDNFKYNNIEMKNLNYTYNDKSYILKNINLKFNKEKIMIIGDSGSGKSTLLKLLMKYHDISKNQILINNIDINNYKEEVIRKNISYISQNEILFTDTIYNNLKTNDSIINEDILTVSKICEIEEFTNDLGLNMLIEENGYNLSGGEKQRIILGRTLLKPFEILLIDEGLNQMDVNLERRILKQIFEKYKDKLIIIISHRLENMDLYDRVIELKDGQFLKEVKKND